MTEDLVEHKTCKDKAVLMFRTTCPELRTFVEALQMLEEKKEKALSATLSRCSLMRTSRRLIGFFQIGYLPAAT